MNTMICIVLLVAMIVSALGTVVIRSLLMAAVSLAVTSICLSVILFLGGLYFAAVMELLVCTGLVTAIFASTIALLKSAPEDEGVFKPTQQLLRYLPLLMMLVLFSGGILLLANGQGLSYLVEMHSPLATSDVLWEERALDIIGLALLILGGVLGVAALVRQREEK